MTETTIASDHPDRGDALRALLDELTRIEDQIDGLIDTRDLLTNRLEHCADQFLLDHPEHDRCCCTAGRYGFALLGWGGDVHQARLRFVTRCSWCGEGRGTDLVMPIDYAELVLAGDVEGLAAYRARRKDEREAAERRQVDDERAVRQRKYEELRREFEPGEVP